MDEFWSIQGEGFHAGRPAWFIRIGGCDVGCSWCDEKESWNADNFPPVDTDLVVDRALGSLSGSVIVTGGEPLLYNLDYFCERLKGQGSGILTFIETSGCRPLSGQWDWICLSPKRDWPPRDEFHKLGNELKVIIQGKEDFVWAEEQAGKIHPGAHLFLQPEWSRRAEILPEIIRYIHSCPKWRLSLQIHKYAGIP